MTNENYDLALDAFDNAIVLASANPVIQAHIYRARSITLMRSDQQELAEEAMRTAIRLDPTNACHYSDLGGIILDRELQSKKLTPTEALTYLDKAIEMDPINGYVYLSRAPAVRVLEQMEDLAMASDLGCEEGDYSGCYSQYCEALPEYD